MLLGGKKKYWTHKNIKVLHDKKTVNTNSFRTLKAFVNIRNE